MKLRLLAWIVAVCPPLASCEGEEADRTQILDLQADVSADVVTVVTVRWETDNPTGCHVEYGPVGERGLETPGDTPDTRVHEQLLLGLPASTEVEYQVQCTEGVVSDVRTVTTGNLPIELPGIAVSGVGHEHYMAVPLIGNTTAATILDPDGNIVWYTIDNRELDIYRVRLAGDGQGVIYNAASVSGDPAEDSEIVRVSFDGSDRTAIPVPLLAHDFVELPDGTLAAIVVEYREFDGEDLRGDQIIEIAPDGTQQVVWSAWDCWDPAEVIGTDTEFGWTWANALDYHPDEDAYYLSIRNFSTIVKIDRSSGECLWGLSGAAGTLELDGGSSPFLHEHQFHVLEDTIVVFDNDGAGGTRSRVIEYAYDVDAGTAEEVWSYTPDPSIYSFVLGDVTRMEGGDSLVTWATLGQIQRVTPDQQIGWQLNTDLGYALGFNEVLESLYVAD